MFCRRCGAQVADGSALCPRCGERLSAAAPSRRPDLPYEVLGMLALVAMLVLTVVSTASSVEKIMQSFPYYEAPLAAVATAVFATCGLLMGGIAALGAALLARDLRARSPRGRGALVRGAVAAGLLVACCLALLAAAADLGGAGAPEEVEALHQALLAHWDVALYGLVPSVVALVALCFGAGRQKSSS